TLDVRREVDILEDLVEITNETASINILQSTKRVCIEKVDGTEDIRQFVRLGQPYSLVKGASGKIFLAFSKKEFIEEVLLEWEREKNEQINRESFYDTISNIRDKGYAISIGERVLGSYSISAPIFDVT